MYQNPAKIAAIIEKLRDEGLQFEGPDDYAKLKHYLGRIGERRLLQYSNPFRRGHVADGRFFAGVTVRHVRNLYKFDHRLRLELLDGLERVEVSIKSDLHHELSLKYGENWLLKGPFLDDFLYGESRNHSDQFMRENEETLNSLRKDISRHPTKSERYLPDSFIIARRLERDHSVVCNSMTFGTMSKIYGRTTTDIKSRIATYYHCPNGQLLSTMLWGLSIVRNAAAHHDRVYDIFLRQQILFPDPVTMLLKSHQPPRDFNRKIYGVSIALFWLLRRIARKTTWHKRLQRTLEIGDALVKPLDLHSRMAFPKNWGECELWKS